MVDIGTVVSSCLDVDSLPSGFGDSDPTDLDRLAASLHHLGLCCGKHPMNESDRHSSTEAVTEDQQFLVDAVPLACEHL